MEPYGEEKLDCTEIRTSWELTPQKVGPGPNSFLPRLTCVFRFRDFNDKQTNKEKMILKLDVTHQAIVDVVAAVCVIILYTHSTHFHMCVQCTAQACVQKRISEKQKQQRFPCGKRTRLDIFSCFPFLFYFKILFWHYFSLFLHIFPYSYSHIYIC